MNIFESKGPQTKIPGGGVIAHGKRVQGEVGSKTHRVDSPMKRESNSKVLEIANRIKMDRVHSKVVTAAKQDLADGTLLSYETSRATAGMVAVAIDSF